MKKIDIKSLLIGALLTSTIILSTGAVKFTERRIWLPLRDATNAWDHELATRVFSNHNRIERHLEELLKLQEERPYENGKGESAISGINYPINNTLPRLTREWYNRLGSVRGVDINGAPKTFYFYQRPEKRRP